MREDRSWNGRDEEQIQLNELTTSIINGGGVISVNGGTNGKSSGDEIGVYEFSDEEREWRQFALCRGLDGNIFFPERGHSMLPAYAICRGCSVRMECLVSAIDNGDKWGIRGGFTPEERKKINRVVKQEKTTYETASKPFDERRHKRLLRAVARVGMAGIRSMYQSTESKAG